LLLEPDRERRLSRNPRRAAYYCGAVSSLAAELAARGARLIVRRGPAAKVATRLARELEARTVCWSASYDAAAIDADRGLQAALEEAGIRVAIVHDGPAVPPEETAAARSDGDGSGYRALAPYVAAWRSRRPAPEPAVVRFASPPLVSEALPQPADFGPAASLASAAASPVSETRELGAFETYLAGPALAYRTARNVPAAGATARLSAALSFGVVSARSLLARIAERERDAFLLAEERASLDALTGALARRDFFLQLGWYFEGVPDLALQPRMRGFPFADSHPALPAWSAGRTGFPLVDAGMRQLAAEGWMHPRVRLVAASFLCFDLGVDWRAGRDVWDERLIEDEPALATGNWQWVAGVGADLAQVPRIFNPQRQARWFDPRGAYVRRWIPELAGVPDAAVFEPESASRRNQLALALFGDSGYPAPVVDHERAARAFLARYAAFTRPSPPAPRARRANR
jgi:deoxyribodipyrimidine photo-lyase